MKKFFTIVLVFFACNTFAQKIDSMFVNLYTDSLKIGTYNYINVDGLLSDGSYTPLDSSHIVFSSDHGKFYGNSLWLDTAFAGEKVCIRIEMRNDASKKHQFDMYIKKGVDEVLATEEELINGWKKKKKKD